MSASAPRLQHSDVSIDGLTLIELPEAVVQPMTGLLKHDFVLLDEPLNTGVGDNRLTESDALLSVSDSIVLSSLSKAKTLSNNEAALELEVLHEQQPACTSLTNALRLFNNNVVEEYVNEGNGVLTKFGQMSGGYTLGLALNKPERHLVVLASRILVLADNDEVRNISTIGNPSLLTIQNIRTISLLLRGHGHAHVVGTSSRLGEAESSNGLTGLLVLFHDNCGLLRGAELSEVSASEHTSHERGHGTGELIELLSHETQGYVVRRNATNLFGKAHEGEACVAICVLGLGANLMVFIHLTYGLIVEVAVCILLEGLNKKFLLVGESKIHNLLLLLARPIQGQTN